MKHTPDTWRLVRFELEHGTIVKVFCGWYGGYARADEWRLSSGVFKVEDCGDHYIAHNNSGSQYQLYKVRERWQMVTHSEYQYWLEETDLPITSPDMTDYLKQTTVD